MSSAVATVGRGIKRLVQVVLALVVLVGLYYALGGHLVHEIDADPAFAEDVAVPDGGSTLVATMAALVRREVNQHGWVANDPVVFPSSLLDDMAQYQQALVAATRATTEGLAARAGDATPAELAGALDGLATAPDRWTFDFARSLEPQEATERRYREAADALTRFNAELAAGTYGLAGDAASVAAMIDDFARTLRAAAEAGLAQVDARGGHWLDTTTDDRFQRTRAHVYARLLFLRAIAADHPEVFAPHGATLERALADLKRAAGIGPWYVMNGPADGQWRPSHLAAQGAYVLRASAALRTLAGDLRTDDT